MSARLTQLDSLRGLAALTVLFSHCVELPTAFDRTSGYRLLLHSPLSILLAGHEAVIFFFLLSGFVLSLPFFRTAPSYREFIVKRFCRIYLPYYASIVLAVILALTIPCRGIPELGPWFNHTWTAPITLHMLLQHALLIGSFNMSTLNPVIWSLGFEMRISLLFPLIGLLLARASWKKCLLLSLLLTVINICSRLLVRKVCHSHFADSDYTLHYTAFFIIGGLLAKHRGILTERVAQLAPAVKAGLLLAAITAYTIFFWCPFQPPYCRLFFDWCTAAGSAYFIILALASRSVASVLTSKAVHFIGLTSFSIYLFHCQVLFTLVHLLYGKVALWQIWVMTLAGTMLLASLMYYVVEVPSINIGRFWARKIAPRGPAPLAKQPTVV